MARKQTRSRADQPQSNTVLIVFLVFSILLNLGLGVFLYLAQDQIVQASDKEKKAVATMQDIEKQRNVATNALVPLLRVAIGDTTLTAEEINGIKEHMNDLGKLQSDKTAWYTGKMWKELMGKNQNDNGIIGPFSDTTGKPRTSLIDKVRDLNEQLSKAVDKLKAAEANLAKVTADAKKYAETWNAEKYAKDLKTNQDAAEQDKNNKLKQKDEQIAVGIAKLTDTTNEMEKLLNDNRKAYDTKVASLKGQVDEQIKNIADERKKELERKDITRITSLNVPKARIVAYEPGSDMALIDLGSAIKLPLGLTFSVHERDNNGVAKPHPKAEVEVIRILGDQLAQVRITRMARPDADRMQLPTYDANPEQETRFWDGYYTSDTRDFAKSNKPLYKGDLLFNVVWDPAKRTRVALVGDFDLNGDGTDDILELIAFLRGQGAEVDLYLDKANNYKPKGKLDFGTDLVVLGDVPLIDIKGGATQIPTNRGTDLFREGLAVQKEALEKGIRIVQLPRFLNEIGITPPAVMKNKALTVPSEAPAQTAPAEKKEGDAKPGQ